MCIFRKTSLNYNIFRNIIDTSKGTEDYKSLQFVKSVNVWQSSDNLNSIYDTARVSVSSPDEKVMWVRLWMQTLVVTV